MRKLVLSLVIGVVAVALMSGMASAQNTISMTNSSSNVTFSSLNSATDIAIQFGSCIGTACSLSGGGSFVRNSITQSAGTYTISYDTGVVGNLVGHQISGNEFSVTGGPVDFHYQATIGNVTQNLFGTLTLVSVDQSLNGTAEFNNNKIVGNFTPTGGTLAVYFPHGTSTITIDISGQGNLVDLLAPTNGGPLSGEVLTGQITGTPEPGSMALLGSGLLMIGGALRRRLL